MNNPVPFGEQCLLVGRGHVHVYPHIYLCICICMCICICIHMHTQIYAREREREREREMEGSADGARMEGFRFKGASGPPDMFGWYRSKTIGQLVRVHSKGSQQG